MDLYKYILDGHNRWDAELDHKDNDDELREDEFGNESEFPVMF